MRSTIFIFIFILIFGFNAFAQSTAEDSVTNDALMRWVERKLTFNYFDPTNQTWWINRMHINEDGSITLMNIAAAHPNKVLEKVYHLRRLFLYDISPNTLNVIELSEDQGRFVKGRIVRMEGFGSEQKIATKKDGLAGSDVSFVHISVPAFLEDSLQNYAFELKDKLSRLIFLNARLVNTGDEKKNKAAILSAWRGNYVNQDGTHNLMIKVVDPGHCRFEWKGPDKRWFGQFGYDEKRKVFFLFRSSDTSYFFDEFKIDETTSDLVLKSGTDMITIIGRNTIEFTIQGKRHLFSRQ